MLVCGRRQHKETLCYKAFSIYGVAACAGTDLGQKCVDGCSVLVFVCITQRYSLLLLQLEGGKRLCHGMGLGADGYFRKSVWLSV